MQAQVVAATKAAGRSPTSVDLLAVTKGRSPEVIAGLYSLGQRHFGENYLQEALLKIRALSDLAITWHFIGSLQSKKSRDIAQHFDWVHSVSSLSVAQKLNCFRAQVDRAPLQVCVQVNISGDENKSGVHPDEVCALALAIDGLESLRLRGLMTILANDLTPGEIAKEYENMAQLQQSCKEAGLPVDTLSMGMSGDYPQAIAAGATCVRVGRALFGAR